MPYPKTRDDIHMQPISRYEEILDPVMVLEEREYETPVRDAVQLAQLSVQLEKLSANEFMTDEQQKQYVQLKKRFNLICDEVLAKAAESVPDILPADDIHVYEKPTPDAVQLADIFKELERIKSPVQSEQYHLLQLKFNNLRNEVLQSVKSKPLAREYIDSSSTDPTCPDIIVHDSFLSPHMYTDVDEIKIRARVEDCLQKKTLSSRLLLLWAYLKPDYPIRWTDCWVFHDELRAKERNKKNLWSIAEITQLMLPAVIELSTSNEDLPALITRDGKEDIRISAQVQQHVQYIAQREPLIASCDKKDTFSHIYQAVAESLYLSLHFFFNKNTSINDFHVFDFLSRLYNFYDYHYSLKSATQNLPLADIREKAKIWLPHLNAFFENTLYAHDPLNQQCLKHALFLQLSHIVPSYDIPIKNDQNHSGHFSITQHTKDDTVYLINTFTSLREIQCLLESSDFDISLSKDHKHVHALIATIIETNQNITTQTNQQIRIKDIWYIFRATSAPGLLFTDAYAYLCRKMPTITCDQLPELLESIYRYALAMIAANDNKTDLINTLFSLAKEIFEYMLTQEPRKQAIFLDNISVHLSIIACNHNRSCPAPYFGLDYENELLVYSTFVLQMCEKTIEHDNSFLNGNLKKLFHLLLNCCHTFHYFAHFGEEIRALKLLLPALLLPYFPNPMNEEINDVIEIILRFIKTAESYMVITDEQKKLFLREIKRIRLSCYSNDQLFLLRDFIASIKDVSAQKRCIKLILHRHINQPASLQFAFSLYQYGVLSLNHNSLAKQYFLKAMNFLQDYIPTSTNQLGDWAVHILHLLKDSVEHSKRKEEHKIIQAYCETLLKMYQPVSPNENTLYLLLQLIQANVALRDDQSVIKYGELWLQEYAKLNTSDHVGEQLEVLVSLANAEPHYQSKLLEYISSHNDLEHPTISATLLLKLSNYLIGQDKTRARQYGERALKKLQSTYDSAEQNSRQLLASFKLLVKESMPHQQHDALHEDITPREYAALTTDTDISKFLQLQKTQPKAFALLSYVVFVKIDTNIPFEVFTHFPEFNTIDEVKGAFDLLNKEGLLVSHSEVTEQTEFKIDGLKQDNIRHFLIQRQLLVNYCIQFAQVMEKQIKNCWATKEDSSFFSEQWVPHFKAFLMLLLNNDQYPVKPWELLNIFLKIICQQSYETMLDNDFIYHLSHFFHQSRSLLTAQRELIECQHYMVQLIDEPQSNHSSLANNLEVELSAMRSTIFSLIEIFNTVADMARKGKNQSLVLEYTREAFYLSLYFAKYSDEMEKALVIDSLIRYFQLRLPLHRQYSPEIILWKTQNLTDEFQIEGLLLEAVSIYNYLYEKKGMDSAGATLWFYLGFFYYHQGQHREAMEYFDQSLPFLSQSARLSNNYAECLCIIARSSYYLGQHEQAKNFLQQGITFCEENPTKILHPLTTQGQLLFYLSKVHVKMQESSEVINCLKRCVNLHTANNEIIILTPEQLAEAYYYLLKFSHHVDHKADRKKYFCLLLEKHWPIAEVVLKFNAKDYYQLAMIAWKISAYDDAITFLEKSLNVHTKNEKYDSQLVANAYANLAILYHAFHNEKKDEMFRSARSHTRRKDQLAKWSERNFGWEANACNSGIKFCIFYYGCLCFPLNLPLLYSFFPEETKGIIFDCCNGCCCLVYNPENPNLDLPEHNETVPLSCAASTWSAISTSFSSIFGRTRARYQTPPVTNTVAETTLVIQQQPGAQ